MGKTTIEWTDRTWNPTRGCSRVSHGCERCYAERMAARFSGNGFRAHDKGQPFDGFVHIVNGHPAWTGKVELIESKLMEPLRWRKPSRIFVNSMSDLFHEALPDETIDRVFAVMALCPEHTKQVLTKRPRRMLEYFSDPVARIASIATHMETISTAANCEWRFDGLPDLPLENVWLGVSVEDQKTADERIPLLLQTPAAIRFVSYEPALGPVDWERVPFEPGTKASFRYGSALYIGDEGGIDFSWTPRRLLHWVIIGGESGPGARTFDIAWARNTVRPCRLAGVACFVKQLGAKPLMRSRTDDKWPDGSFTIASLNEPQISPRMIVRLRDRKGGDMAEWPEDLRVREFPEVVG